LNIIRKNPVAILGLVATILTAINAFVVANPELVNPDIAKWIAGATALIIAVQAWWTRQQVTSLAEPKNADGEKLVPASEANQTGGPASGYRTTRF
jgi:hypothetical protein